MPRSCRSCESRSPDGPPPMIPTCVFMRDSRRSWAAWAVALRLLARVDDRLELVELDVLKLAAALLDLAQVDVLHDVARRRVDRDRAARARRLPALGDLHRLVRVDVAAALRDDLVDERHAVVRADRHEVRAARR